MRVFAGFGDHLGQAISYAEHLFKQIGTITLLTGHKAKGLEWHTVYHLDSWLLGETEQELNLRYVILTRAMNSYYEIDSREIRWSS
jgi:superfamily I DNA/RNA helicase